MNSLQAVGLAIKAANPVGVLIAARGSSDNAAVYAKYVFQLRNRLPVALAAPSLFTQYGAPPRVERYCVLGISQSGAAPDVLAVVEEGRRQGAVTVALTNEPDSALAAAADFVIPLQAGPERSLPASKTYPASLVGGGLSARASRCHGYGLSDHPDRGTRTDLRGYPRGMCITDETGADLVSNRRWYAAAPRSGGRRPHEQRSARVADPGDAGSGRAAARPACRTLSRTRSRSAPDPDQSHPDPIGAAQVLVMLGIDI